MTYRCTREFEGLALPVVTDPGFEVPVGEGVGHTEREQPFGEIVSSRREGREGGERLVEALLDPARENAGIEVVRPELLPEEEAANDPLVARALVLDAQLRADLPGFVRDVGLELGPGGPVPIELDESFVPFVARDPGELGGDPPAGRIELRPAAV